MGNPPRAYLVILNPYFPMTYFETIYISVCNKDQNRPTLLLLNNSIFNSMKKYFSAGLDTVE